jgi:PAS domain S-box-containing protein
MLSASLTRSLIRFGRNLWQAGTAPWVPIAERTQAEYTAFVLGGEAVAFAVFFGFRVLTEPYLTTLYRLTNGGLITAFGVAYVLSRLGRYRQAAWLSAILIAIIVYIVVLTGSVITPVYVLTPLNWITAQLLVISWVVRPRSTLLLALLHVVGLLILPFIRPDLIPYNLAPLELQSILLSILIVANAYFRQRDRREIGARTAELSASEDRYRTLFNHAFESVLVHRNFEIIDANPSLEAMSGYNRAELLTMRTLDLLTPESRQMVPPPDQIPETAQYEMQGVHKDGTIFPVEVRSKAIFYQGQPARALSVRDLSTQREAERNRSAIALEQQRSQLMRDFIRDASHDLRTPMAVINTKLYLMERYIEQPEKLREQITSMTTQVARLSHMLDDMLVLTQLDQKPLHLALAPIDLNTIADWLSAKHQREAKDQGLHLHIETSPEPIRVRADAAEYTLAISRLVENALRYTPPGGAITLRTRTDQVSGFIDVIDTGVGIPPEAVPHIFDRFYRVDPSRNSETGGAGLGLAIAHKVIEAHGGQIKVKSTPGQGSTFSVSLPLEPQAAPESLPVSV